MNRGDIIQLGRHRLMCGDAFSQDDRAALLQGEKPDMLYCDPPYGMKTRTSYTYRKQWGTTSFRPCMERGDVAVGNDYAVLEGDDKPFDVTSLIEAFCACEEQFWWGADYYSDGLSNAGSWIVWDKRRDGAIDAMWGSVFEMCWSKKKHRREIARVLWCGILGMNGVDQGKRLHPTQKPIRLAEWFLERYSKPDALVLDLFGGSGSTLLACERMGRRAALMEISPAYCDVIVGRYHALIEKQRLPLFDGVAS